MRRLWIALLLLVALVGDAFARPKLEPAAHAGRVTVLAEPGLERMAQRLADGAETTLARIAKDLDGLSVPTHIELRLVRDASDLARVAPEGRGAPPWAIGVAYPDLGIISVAMQREGKPSDPEATTRHELAHIALGTALGPRAPHWLHEGFAYQHSAEWSSERVETLAGMAWFDSVIPLEDLDHSFPAAEQPAHRAYAESYDFVGFLSRRGRWEDRDDDGDRWPFRMFLGEIGRGADPDAAARKAYGRSLQALFVEWRRDLDDRYQLMPMTLLGLVAWIITALLLVLAFIRRRKQNRVRLAQWEHEEALAIERARLERERLRALLLPSFATPHEPDLLN